MATRKTNSFTRTPNEAKSLLKNADDGKPSYDDDADARKKQNFTAWKRQRRICLCLILTFSVFALTARGYHRRRHNALREEQRAAWKKFFRQHQKRGAKKRGWFGKKKKKPETMTAQNNINNNNNAMKNEVPDIVENEPEDDDEDDDDDIPDTIQERVKYLHQNPDVAKEWREHKKENTDGLFDEKPEPEWKPHESGNPVEQLADGLGAAAEVIGGWVHDGMDTVLGQNVSDSFGDAVEEAVDSFGDWTDDVEEAMEKFTEDMGEAWENLFSASSDSVDDWMNATGRDNATGSAEEWMNWTSSFGIKRASSFLWNYSTEEEAAIDTELDALDAAEDALNKRGNATVTGRKNVTRVGFVSKLIKEIPHVKTADGNNVSLDRKMAFITTNFPTDVNQTWRFEKYVLGALQTYLEDNVLFYIVNTRARKVVQEVCNATKANQKACDRLIPIYVACPSREYGIATCCHQDKGMAAMYRAYPDFDYYIYHQDDLYFRTKYLKTYVDDLGMDPQNNAYLLSASPFRSHGQVLPEPPYTAESLKKARESRNNCSYAPQHIYPWGRPALMYSNAALKEVVPAYRKLAISKQCVAFSVPAASASPIVHWMFQMPLVKLPAIASRTPMNLTSSLALRKLPKSSDGTESRLASRLSPYKPTHRSIAFKANSDTKDGFDKIHDALAEATKANPEESLYPQPPYRYNWHRPTGFQDTEVFKSHGFAQNWTTSISRPWRTFRPSDCITHAQIAAQRKAKMPTTTRTQLPKDFREFRPKNKEIRESLNKHGLVDTNRLRKQVLERAKVEMIMRREARKNGLMSRVGADGKIIPRQSADGQSYRPRASAGGQYDGPRPRSGDGQTSYAGPRMAGGQTYSSGARTSTGGQTYSSGARASAGGQSYSSGSRTSGGQSYSSGSRTSGGQSYSSGGSRTSGGQTSSSGSRTSGGQTSSSGYRSTGGQTAGSRRASDGQGYSSRPRASGTSGQGYSSRSSSTSEGQTSNLRMSAYGQSSGARPYNRNT